MAAAATLINISPFLGVGTSRVTTFITYIHEPTRIRDTSGPPYLVISMQRMVLGMVEKQRSTSILITQRGAHTARSGTAHKAAQHSFCLASFSICQKKS